MSEEITQDHINEKIAQVRTAEQASRFLESESGKWFISLILGTLNDEAVELLARAKTEEERMFAQQTLLASRKPRQLIDRFIMQGELARQAILDLPPKEDDHVQA